MKVTRLEFPKLTRVEIDKCEEELTSARARFESFVPSAATQRDPTFPRITEPSLFPL
jgi:hypothetical protein